MINQNMEVTMATQFVSTTEKPDTGHTATSTDNIEEFAK
jgi:hypothetical protein